MKKSNLTFILVILLLAGSTTFGYAQDTVTIGTQTWMKKNLDVSKYRNGDLIPQVTDPTAWRALTTGAWCWYENNSANGTIYGKLYNWYAVNDPRGLAPAGWHVPKNAEWNTLSTYLGGQVVAGSAMKETGTTHWISPNSNATNSSGWTGLPGGTRSFVGPFGQDLGSYGYWWSSSESNTYDASRRGLDYEFVNLDINEKDKRSGYSVRCIRD